MQTFQQLGDQFQQYFSTEHFPDTTPTLYEPNRYFLQLGGKRIRPVCVLMGNELFGDIHPDAWNAATAIELFHNFTLIHDDIMDKAPLRRGMETVHEKYGNSTALLAGDVMLVTAYDYLNKTTGTYLHRILKMFNQAARLVCEGQQLDMDYEQHAFVSSDEYLNMITLKTSVLLAASLQIGAIIGGGSQANAGHLYEFGKNLGIAFQVQDDYLDAFGDPMKFGKQVGGDIMANKKTFLLLHAQQSADEADKKQIASLLQSDAYDKVEQMLELYKKYDVDDWARRLKDKYYQEALMHLEAVAVVSYRKAPLQELAEFLIDREM
jgi:geranylgeranyl diphosphate synthase, type II